jgi:phage/plasmid-like protein (TIGR03299 family)
MIGLTTREATWTNIGHNVEMCTTVDEVITNAGLNYDVEKRPLYIDGGNNGGITVPDRFATFDVTNGKIKGVVGNNYKILQNKDAFDFVNGIDEDISFVKAGETGSGMIYIIGRLNDVQVLGDVITPYVIFQNGHNGIYTLKTTICPLRIVCQNQFAMSFKSSPNTISIHHSNSMEGKLVQAQELMRDVAGYMKQFNDTAEELAALNLNGTSANDIFRAFFMQSINKDNERALRTVDEKTTLITNIYNYDDNQNFRGTVWGLVNAYADYTTHLLPQRTTETSNENKFVTVTMDPRIINAFVEFAKQFSSVR